jgi:hypothetical protein
MADYADLEQQCLDIIRLNSELVLTWDRVWTNQGRRALQRKHNFKEMLQFYPSEGLPSSTWETAAASRAYTWPENFKDVAGHNDGLFIIKSDGSHKALNETPFSRIAQRYSQTDTGEPEVYVRAAHEYVPGVPLLYLYPLPDAAYTLRVHGYFYLDDLPDGQLEGQSDFLLVDGFMALRDAILQEAYAALEMRDMAVFAAKGRQDRTDDMINDAKDREMPRNFSIAPSLDAGPGEDRREWGYPWWGRK